MARRNDYEFKITDPEEMTVKPAKPSQPMHPGQFIRDVLLPEYSLKIAPAARLIKMDRASFHNVLEGRHAVSRDLAYKLGALMRDEVADLLINMQAAYDHAHDRERREAFKLEIERLPEPAGVAA